MAFRCQTSGWLYLFPQMAVIIIFFIWPSLRAIVQSFYFSDAFGLYQVFSGFQNYVDVWHDASFLKAGWVTIFIALMIDLFACSLGLLLAFVVSERTISRRGYKTLFLFPYAVAPAVAAILWRFLWQPSIGWFSYALHQLGIDIN